MLLTFWGHACVSLDHEGRRLVVDPGVFSDVAGALEGAEAVLVTHEHADHVQVQALAAHLAAHTGAVAHVTGAVAEALTAQGADTGRVHVLTPGDRRTVAGVEVEVGGGAHAVIHPDIPVAVNVTLLLGGAVWHPGDSLDLPPGGVRVLLVPVGGPWLRLADAIDYVRAARPELVVPIHGGMFTPDGLTIPLGLLGRLGGAPLRPLAVGESLALD